MTIRPIALWGRSVLLKRAAEVEHPEAIAELILDMLDTLRDAEGIGLAAPQIFVSLRVLVALRVDLEGDAWEAPPLVLINPVLEFPDDAVSLGHEGCLSIPGMRGAVLRYDRVTYSAIDPRGETIQGEARGLLARVLQHEVDHLDGILYPMRLRSPGDMGFESAIAEQARADEQSMLSARAETRDSREGDIVDG